MTYVNLRGQNGPYFLTGGKTQEFRSQEQRPQLTALLVVIGATEQFLHPSEPQLPYLQNGDNRATQKVPHTMTAYRTSAKKQGSLILRVVVSFIRRDKNRSGGSAGRWDEDKER